MPTKKTDVDDWLNREDDHIRKALENASTYFDNKDVLDVHTLEAIYGQESSFGINRNQRGIDKPAGDFQLEKATAVQYGIFVSKENDQRFDVDYASIAAARYLKDLDTMFSKEKKLAKDRITVPIKDAVERKKFVLAAYNNGQGHIAHAQVLAQKAGKDPTRWEDVQLFLKAVNKRSPLKKPKEVRDYVRNVLKNEIEFMKKSLADKKSKHKKLSKPSSASHKGHWITKNHLHIYIWEKRA